jgi:hypothetical protein
MVTAIGTYTIGRNGYAIRRSARACCSIEPHRVETISCSALKRIDSLAASFALHT